MEQKLFEMIICQLLQDIINLFLNLHSVMCTDIDSNQNKHKKMNVALVEKYPEILKED